MHRISVIGDTQAQPEHLNRQLGSLFQIEFTSLASKPANPPRQHTLIDIDLNKDPQLLPLKEWLRQKPTDAKVIFVTDKASRLQEARAYALGATGIIHRPIDGRALLTKLWGETPTLEAVPAAPSENQAPGVAAAVDTLKSIFSVACSGAPLDSSAIQSAGEVVVDQVEAQGLVSWIETVRMHHSQTYQHCLLVTGLAVAFGQQIGASRKDRRRLSFAGMLHDIGKARIPLAILEKPGPLDKNELEVMRKHPQYGLDALGTVSGLPAEMLDMVVHHHELLDGTGYPHGLTGNEIPDLVRIITISDVFGALIERRSYKPPLTGEAAYNILLDMGPKLDRDLVRAFKFVANLSRH